MTRTLASDFLLIAVRLIFSVSCVVLMLIIRRPAVLHLLVCELTILDTVY
jgi:hypothetical protein